MRMVHILYIYIRTLACISNLEHVKTRDFNLNDGICVFFSARIEYPSVVEMFSVEAGFRNGSTESEDMV